MIDNRFVHYRTGIDRIDLPHKKILLALQEIDLLIAEQNYERVLPQIDRINDHLIEELKEENKEMLDNGYPYKYPHIESHNELLKNFQNLYKEVEHLHMFPQAKRYKFRDHANMFYDHIDKYDIMYADWLKNNQKLVD